MSLVGQSPARPDGLPKVSGTARYGDDLKLPGLLFGATLRSPHPRAKLRSVRWNADRAPAGAICVTAADIPGPNGVQLIDDDWPILADEVTEHVGEAIALVAAPTRLAALRALEAVEVEYEPLPAALDLEDGEALPLLAELTIQRGDLDDAFANAGTVVEGTYTTGHQEHIYIECQVMTAWFDDGGLHLVGSMQCPYYVHKSLAHVFDLPDEEIQVKASAVGGGFGGKEDYPSMIALHAALLAQKAGRPVRIAYDRHEDIISTTKRHPAVIKHRSAVDEDGRLQAMDIDVVMDGGAYRTLSTVVLSRALLHATGPYGCPNVRIHGRVLKTNTATNGAFRGFGAPQSQFAAECQIEKIGRALGIDPVTIRRRNLLREGDTLPTGQVVDSTTAAESCLDRVLAETDFEDRWQELEAARRSRQEHEPYRGLGLSLFFHGAGFTGNGERRMRSPVTVRLTEAGQLEVLTANTDMGQGCSAIFPQMARQATALSAEDIVFAEPDTARVPNSGPTVASRTTMIVGEGIIKASTQLCSALLEWWRTEQGDSNSAPLEIVDGQIVSGTKGWPFREVASKYFAQHGDLETTHRHEPPAWQTFDETTYEGAAYPTYAWGADVVEVEVDPDSLEVRPITTTAVCDVGTVIHPTLCKGQVEGGTLQALGWALLEEVKMKDGHFLNDRLATYIIPTFKDSGRIDVFLQEQPWDGGPFGAKGVGELPMDGGAPAAVAALGQALGVSVDRIPATPERLMASLTKENE